MLGEYLNTNSKNVVELENTVKYDELVDEGHLGEKEDLPDYRKDDNRNNEHANTSNDLLKVQNPIHLFVCWFI